MLVGEELYKLIPQRNPIVMVDTFFCADEESAETGLHVQSGNLFCEGDNLREPGMIEHVAQSAAAFAGYEPYMIGRVRYLDDMVPEVDVQIRMIAESLKE